MKPTSIEAGRALHNEQSIKAGFFAALVVLFLVNLTWVATSMFFDRFFPWISIIQGIILGKSARKYGYGIDWRLPLMSFFLALFASISGSFISALFLTGREFNTGGLVLINEISWHTVSTFMLNEYGIVGCIYGIFSGVLAAFYSLRELNRDEAIAYRKFKKTINIREDRR